MMTQAFYTGISGLKSNQYALDVVSDNLANISSTGFRGYDMEFQSLFEDSLNNVGGSNLYDSVGLGSTFTSATMMLRSGPLQLSDKATDLAIMGDGWFGVQGFNEPIYTRDGSFTFDANDDLVTLDGFHVLGTMGGNIQNGILTSVLDEIPLSDVSAQEKLQFPKFLTYPSEPTTTASFLGNIGIDDEVRGISAGVVDAQGNRNQLKLTFNKAAVQPTSGTTWDVVATTTTLDGTTVYDTQTGSVTFDSSGALVSTTLSSVDNNGTSVSIDLGSGYTGVTAISNLDITASSMSNGIQGGELEGYDVNVNGEIVATFTNGMQSKVGKVAVFHFQNDQGLERINGSRFQESANSGAPIFYKDANGQNILGADVVNFKLEGSNVDMSYGLTELIILQRSFDANSKTVKTADEMMQKALNMDA